MLKVLYIEDSQDWVDIITDSLQDEGEDLTFYSSNSLVEANKILKKEKFDVVICDGSITDPNDGLKYAEQLHAQGQPVILLSVSLRSAKFPSMGKNEYDPQKLYNLIKKVIK